MYIFPFNSSVVTIDVNTNKTNTKSLSEKPPRTPVYRVAKSRWTLARQPSYGSEVYNVHYLSTWSRQSVPPACRASPTKTQIQEDPITSRREPIRRDTDGRYHSLTGAASATVPWSGIQDDEPKAACTYVCSTAQQQCKQASKRSSSRTSERKAARAPMFMQQDRRVQRGEASWVLRCSFLLLLPWCTAPVPSRACQGIKLLVSLLYPN
jgi:hypothetical protein